MDNVFPGPAGVADAAIRDRRPPCHKAVQDRDPSTCVVRPGMRVPSIEDDPPSVEVVRAHHLKRCSDLASREITAHASFQQCESSYISVGTFHSGFIEREVGANRF